MFEDKERYSDINLNDLIEAGVYDNEDLSNDPLGRLKVLKKAHNIIKDFLMDKELNYIENNDFKIIDQFKKTFYDKITFIAVKFPAPGQEKELWSLKDHL